MGIQLNATLKPKSNQIYGLDFIRFAAALLVSVFHFAFRPAVHPDSSLHAFLPATPGLPPGYWFTWFGWIGVQIFFVLSGFVIAYSCRAETTRTFIIKRFLRLAPAMWISATICLVISILLGLTPFTHAVIRTLRSVVFFPFGPWIAGAIWTLPIEINFYAALSIILFMGRKQWIEGVAMVLALLSAAYWIAQSFGLGDSYTRLTQLFLLQHGCQFALGLLLWCSVDDRLTPARLLMMAVCAGTGFRQIAATAVIEAAGFVDRLPLMVPIGIWMTAVVLIYLSACFNMQADRYLAPYNKFVRQGGLLTYPLYLIHYHAGGAVLFLAHRASIGFGSAVALALLTSIALSWWISVYPEPALKRVMSPWFTGRSGRVSQPLAPVQ